MPEELTEDMEDPLGNSELTFTASWVAVDDGVRLRLLHWRPKREKKSPVLFVAGWVSVIQGWRELIEELARDRAVYYLETREKSSARISRKRLTRRDFTIDRIALDIINAVRALPIENEELIVMGSSLGATAVLEALKRERLSLHAAFLIGPNARFRFPWWGAGVIRLPAAMYHPVQMLIRWYLRNFRVHVEKEPEQMKRYDATLQQANPLRIKLSAQAVFSYGVWPDLETVRAPVAIAFAESDSLHSADELNRMGQDIPDAVMVSCPSNRFMHSREMISKIDRFLSDISKAA